MIMIIWGYYVKLLFKLSPGVRLLVCGYWDGETMGWKCLYFNWFNDLNYY